MTRLSYEQTLKDNDNGGDPSSVTTLQLNHKALSDVSCLAKFENLEKLDLKLNNLTSLEGLRSCGNLKWLSVVENKLESLEGIQGLTKLTVLNAGKNKLKSMDEVRSIVSLRALILNENEIVSICKLDQMKELNTLVLSKNPIRKIGEALMKVKSITKLSLSYCRLKEIGASLKSCVELRELRLAHNEIKSLPDELKHNSKLLNLDVGNNLIARWSELKVITSLTILRNLNLLGNPVATVDRVTRKVKKSLPKLNIFNAKPVDKDAKNEKGDTIDGVHDFSVDREGQNSRDGTKEKKRARFDPVSENEDHLEDAGDLDSERKSSKKKKNVVNEEGLAPEENVTAIEKRQMKKQKNEKRSELGVIDNPEASFLDLFEIDDAEKFYRRGDRMKVQDKVHKDAKLAGSAMISFTKHKSAKMQTLESMSNPAEEIGMGGQSTWGDE